MPIELLAACAALALAAAIILLLLWASRKIAALQKELAHTREALTKEQAARSALRESTDMLELAANEERLRARKALREMEAAIREADRASQAKSDFLATMSHEIRTPMNAIMGMASLIDASHLDAQSRRYLDDMRKSASALLSIINDILDFSKIEAGKMELIRVHYRLLPMLRNVISLMRLSAHAKLLQFEDILSPELPKVLYGDELRLRQVLLNILGNAVKYTKEGKITFRVWTEGAELWFSVTDTGVGIREEELDRLFAAFEQLDSAKNRHILGTGLGLAISYRLMRLMDGDIQVESEYGVGSAFTLHCPFAEGSAELLEHEDTGEYVEAPEARILVVDDNPMNLTVTCGLLQASRAMVDAADSGYEALHKVKETAYDLVLMDHMMPEMDGIETVTRLRMMGHKHLAVVALTANALSGAREMFLGRGFQDFISKPVAPEDLNAILRKWLPPRLLVRTEPPWESGEADEPLLSVLSALPGLDAAQGFRLSGSDSAVYEKVLRGLADSASARERKMTAHLHKGEYAALQLEIHGLKGVLLSVGAAELSHQAQAAEDAARDSDNRRCLDVFPSFCAQFLEFSGRLGEILRVFAEEEHRPPGELSELRELLLGISDAAESYDSVAAMELLDKIAQKEYAYEIEERLADIRTELESFRIDTVGGQVAGLLQCLTSQFDSEGRQTI